MKNILFVLLASVGVVACVNTEAELEKVQQQEVADLKKEVMEIHDLVMPKMIKMEDLKDSVQALVTEVDIDKAIEIMATSEALDDGIAAMDSWMKNFKHIEKDDSKTHEEKMTYYNEQKAEITTVRDKMLSSIEKAEKLLTQ